MNPPLPETPAQQPLYFKGERLRELREAKGLDIETLAKRLALAPAQLRQLESNQNSLFYSEAIRLTAARRVSEFLGETLVLDAAAVSHAAAAPPQICLAEPRMKIAPASSFGLSGWSAALCLVALSFTGLLGLQGYRHVNAVSGPDLAAQVPSPAASDLVDQPTAGVAAVAPPESPETFAVAALTEPVIEAPPAALQRVADTGCNVSGGAESSFTPAKAGRDPAQIFVQGAPGQVVCVKDSRGQVWRHEFAGTSGRSFVGTAPWLVESAQLAQLQVYFQGSRARPSISGATRLRLIAAEPT